MCSSGWPILHFGLANAIDDRPTDLPHLLRRVAQKLEDLAVDPMAIGDLVIHSEIHEDGPHWSATLYWSPDQQVPSR